MLFALPSLFADLPQPALGAVVIAAAISLADVAAWRLLWSQRKADFVLSIVAFGGVVLFGVLPGIAIAIGMSVANVFRRCGGPTRRLSARCRTWPAGTTWSSTRTPRCSPPPCSDSTGR